MDIKKRENILYAPRTLIREREGKGGDAEETQRGVSGYQTPTTVYLQLLPRCSDSERYHRRAEEELRAEKEEQDTLHPLDCWLMIHYCGYVALLVEGESGEGGCGDDNGGWQQFELTDEARIHFNQRSHCERTYLGVLSAPGGLTFVRQQFVWWSVSRLIRCRQQIYWEQ